jgi:hypothetical protein
VENKKDGWLSKRDELLNKRGWRLSKKVSVYLRGISAWLSKR